MSSLLSRTLKPIDVGITRILKPVERLGAERYLRLMLLAFAASVILTRLFLSLTGYPQVGNGTLHIAHLLWGGCCSSWPPCCR